MKLELVFIAVVLISLASCTWIAVEGEGHTVNTSAEMNTGSANEVDADIDDGDARVNGEDEPGDHTVMQFMRDEITKRKK